MTPADYTRALEAVADAAERFLAAQTLLHRIGLETALQGLERAKAERVEIGPRPHQF